MKNFAGNKFRIDNSSVKLIGYSPWSMEKLIKELEKGTGVENLHGDFVFTGRGTFDTVPCEFIVTTVICVNPYFWYVSDNQSKFIHGENIFDIARKANLKWRWNKRALNCLVIADQVFDHDTLHPLIKKVPCASKILWYGNKLIVEKSDFWERLFNTSGTDPDGLRNTAQTLEKIQDELLENPIAISLSAGFDSRLQLSHVLKKGAKPVTATLGSLEQEDVIISRQIASKFNLEHRIIELKSEQYYQHAKYITKITSGTKTAMHWHTYLFTKLADFPADSLHLVGTNGEFARTWYIDRGILSLIADHFPLDLTRAFWEYKYGWRKYPFPGIKEVPLPGPEKFTDIPKFLTRLSSGPRHFLDKLDYFFATQRVRNFLGNGHVLYNAFQTAYAPFLDVRWIKATCTMQRKEKLGSNFHRYVITRNYPQLLDFPVEFQDRMTARSPLAYWMYKWRYKSYSPFDEIAKSADMKDLLIGSKHLKRIFPDEFIQKNIHKGILVRILFPLHYVGEILEDHKIPWDD